LRLNAHAVFFSQSFTLFLQPTMIQYWPVSSGTGTNKTGGHGKNCRAPPLFGFTSTLSRFVERFRDGQYSLVSFLFAVFLASRAQPFGMIKLNFL